MKREIKFRYIWKRIDDGHIYVTITPIECLEGRGDVPFLGNHLWEMVARSEYTGLKDRNGVEIFEGDVVEDRRPEWRYWIDYKPPAFYLRASRDRAYQIETFRFNEVVVIGNVFENPELLEAK